MKAVEKMQIKCIVGNDSYMAPLMAAHGICYLVTVNNSNILMDVGSSAPALRHNMQIMKINFHDISNLVLTHNHYDHGNALPYLVNEIKNIPLICPKDAFQSVYNPYRETHIYLPHSNEKTNVAIHNFEKVAKTVKNINYVELPFEITDGLMVSGSLPSKNIKEIALYVNLKNKGIVVLTGCAHPGILNIIKNAKETTGIEKIYGLIGGFHLKDYNKEKIKEIANELKEEGLEFILTGHCTGYNAIRILDDLFQEKLKGLNITKTFSTGQEFVIK